MPRKQSKVTVYAYSEVIHSTPDGEDEEWGVGEHGGLIVYRYDKSTLETDSPVRLATIIFARGMWTKAVKEGESP